MEVNGISWRLKVYPNGNENFKGICLSVFIEMYKGIIGWSGQYEYRIELVHRREPKKMIHREFTSNFEATVSWGYNRFFKLEDLTKEGFWNPEEDVVIFLFLLIMN